MVEFELSDFDMSPFCLDPKIACDGITPSYDLIGVVNHMGSMVSGKIYCKLAVNNKNFG